MSILEEAVGGLIVETATLMAKQVNLAARAGGREARVNLELVRWFDTYQLIDAPAFDIESPDIPAGRIADALATSAVQALVFELLAVRLTDAPEIEVERLETAFGHVLGAELADLRTPADDLAESLFEALDRRVRTLVARLPSDASGPLPLIRNEALLGRLNITLSAIERHCAALAGQYNPAADRDFITRYRRQVKTQHGKLEPPDFQQRRRVPIKDLYVPPKIVSVDERGTPGEIDIWALDREIDRTVLLGDPGGGKTTSAHVLMHTHALDAGSSAPFLVTLREFAADDQPARSVVGFIEHRMETHYQCRPPEGLVSRLLLDGAALVIFDGLDELVDTSRRAQVADIVELFCTEFPLARVLVTSRVVGYDQARLDPEQFAAFRVSHFDDKQVKDYVTRWFRQEDGVGAVRAAELAASFMGESAEVPDLRSNPLMLALMCILYRGEGSIPRSRPEVYEECSRLLFTKWDARRRIHVELRARHLIEPALRHLAFWMLTRNQTQPIVSERELITETADFLQTRRFEDRDDAEGAAREFVDFCRGRGWVFSDAGTTAHGENLYTFAHRTFMEYFAAAHLAADCDTPEELARRLLPHLARQEWEMMAQLAVQIKDRTSTRGAERVLESLLGDRRRRSSISRGNVLSFAARCLAFTDPPPHLVRTLTDRVLSHAFEDLTSEAFVEPLRYLLASADSSLTVVAARLEQTISALVQSADEDERVKALRLAINMDDILGTGRKAFWDRWEFRMADLHRSALAAHAYIPDIAVGMWHRLDQLSPEVVAAYEDRFATVFLAPDTGVTRSRWQSIAHWAVAGGAVAPSKIAALARLTERYLSASDFSPKITSTWRDTDLMPTKQPEDPAFYGSFAFMLAVLHERSMPLIAPSKWELGPLRGIMSYLDRRGENEGTLPDLPVDPRIQEMLTRWARREIDFLAPQEADGEG
ncbi:NACHT domain-containing protein [Streptosporangiaceae bacterium NEAU-GS5]|nr:NACHT domain-containing protein [Streptosporangiaceae bacterium NEAU-GS5]